MFVTNRTAFVNLAVLQRLAGLSEVRLEHVFLYDTIGEGGSSLSHTIARLGPVEFARKAAKVADYHLRMRRARRANRRLGHPKYCHEFVVANRIPHSTTCNLNAGPSFERLKQLDVDVLITCVCKNILKPHVLKLPRVAAINIHPSLLPSYRGPMPVFWALWYGETQTGVTFHHMTQRIDCGRIIDQLIMPLDDSQRETHIERAAFRLASERLPHVLRTVSEGDDDTQHVATQREASYFGYPTPLQRKQLRQLRRQRKSSR